MNVIPPNHFDRSKPFYPLMMNYVVQLIGFKELALRGIVGPHSLDELLPRVLKGKPQGTEQDLDAVRRGLLKLMGPLTLRCESQREGIVVEIDDIAREIAREYAYLLPQMVSAAGGALILAHELSKDQPWRDSGPLWEFLRHCRNAAAHRGRFNLLNGEPRRPATWNTLAIAPTLQGTLLFKGADGIGFLSLGDPVRLLWDIEQAYPNICL